MKRINFFNGAQSSTTPTVGNISTTDLVQYANDTAFEVDNVGSPVEGNIYANTTDNVIRYYNGTQWSTIPSLPIDADQVTHDNGANSFTSTDMQGVANEAAGRLDTNETNISTNTTNISTNTTNITNNATDISETRSALGISDGDTDMGVYTGGVITDNTPQTSINQELSDAIEAIPSGLLYQGTWNADTNTPTLVSSTGTSGHYYQVSVDGSTNLDGITDWVSGDWAVFTSTGVWQKLDNTDQVNSVNSKVGNVVLDPDDLDDTSTTNKWNQSHTGDVVGSTALTVQPAAITGKTTEVPESGDFVLFSDTSDSGNLKKADINQLLGGGSGQGGINYIVNSDFETNADDWNTYDDGAVVDPVDGTGGSPSLLTISRTTTASEILRGEASLKVSKASGDAQGEGASTDFTIDPRDLGRQLLVQFDYKMLDSNYVSSDIKIYVYDVDNATLLGEVRNDTDGELISHTGEGNTFQGYFDATDSLNYRLIFHVTTTNTAVYDISIDLVKVGPEKNVPVSVITEWRMYTPTLTGFNAVPASVSFFYRIVAGSIQVSGKFTCGANSAVAAEFGLPNNWLIDPVNNPSIRKVGSLSTSWTASNAFTLLATPNLGYVTLGRNDTAASGLSSLNANTIGNSVDISVEFEVPIKGLSSGALISTTELENQTLIVEGATNSSGVMTANTTNIDFGEVVDTNQAWDGTTYTASRKERVRVVGSVGFNSSSTSSIYSYINGTVNKLLGQGSSSAVVPFSGIVSLEKGDQLTLRSNVTRTLGNSSTDHTLTITPIKDLSVFGVYKDPTEQEVHVHTALGYGSSATKIVRYSTTLKNLGSSVTYTSDATNGDSFTINRTGVYAITMHYEGTGLTNRDFGITKNQASLTTNILSNPVAEVLGTCTADTNNRRYQCSVTLNLVSGDIIRVCTDADTLSGTSGRNDFRIVRID